MIFIKKSHSLNVIELFLGSKSPKINSRCLLSSHEFRNTILINDVAGQIDPLLPTHAEHF